jgi:hypothetical protein
MQSVRAGKQSAAAIKPSSCSANCDRSVFANGVGRERSPYHREECKPIIQPEALDEKVPRNTPGRDHNEGKNPDEDKCYDGGMIAGLHQILGGDVGRDIAGLNGRGDRWLDGHGCLGSMSSSLGIGRAV